MKQKLIDFLNIFIDLQKALVMLLLIVIGIVFRIYGLVNGTELVDLLKNTVIAFFAVQATQHIVATVNTYYNNKNAPEDPTGPSMPTPPLPPGVKL
jgi:hypothetical protein